MRSRTSAKTLTSNKNSSRCRERVCFATDYKLGTCRKTFKRIYKFFRDGDESQFFLTNWRFMMEIRYLDWGDAKMEEFRDERNMRLAATLSVE